MSYELVGPASPMARLVHWLDHWRGWPRSAAAGARLPRDSASFDAMALTESSLEAEIAAMSSTMSSTLAAEHLKAFVDQLPAQQREMLLLHVNHGLAYWEIARRLGMPEQAVLTGLARAYSQLCVDLGSDELQR